MAKKKGPPRIFGRITFDQFSAGWHSEARHGNVRNLHKGRPQSDQVSRNDQNVTKLKH